MIHGHNDIVISTLAPEQNDMWLYQLPGAYCNVGCTVLMDAEPSDPPPRRHSAELCPHWIG
eukprot:COSAG03_NODE_2276_length_2924_cov_1.838938_3_plen_61_part_00